MLSLNIYLITFNCGRELVDIEAFAAGLFKDNGDAIPDLVFISLQEIAPIAQSFLGHNHLRPYFARFIEAVNRAAKSRASYHEIKRHNAGMTALLLLAKSEVLECIGQAEVAEVGVGNYELGNKGAAAVRIAYTHDENAETVPLTFVSAHLAPMEDAVERRNRDWSNIVRGLVFHPQNASGGTPNGDEAQPLLHEDAASGKSIGTSSSGIFNSYPLFVCGDLNYRTNDTKPGPDDHQLFPQPVDDETDAKHYSHLLKHDQLSRELHAGKTLHHLTEASIGFPPTYKYDLDKYHRNASEEPSVWHWAKHRYPSWCDRILFSSYLSNGELQVKDYSCLPLQPTSDHRPVALSVELDLSKARAREGHAYHSPFSLNTRWREQRTAARRKEVAVGVGAYVGLTKEGRILAIATILGLIGVSLLARSIF